MAFKDEFKQFRQQQKENGKTGQDIKEANSQFLKDWAARNPSAPFAAVDKKSAYMLGSSGQTTPQLEALTHRVVNAALRGKESRMDDALAARSSDPLKQAADDAQRHLKDYTHSPAVQKRMRQQDEADAMANDAWDDPSQPQRDETLDRLRKEAQDTQNAYETAQSAAHDRNIYEQDTQDLNAMTPEERKLLTSYGGYLRIQQQDASSEMGPEPGEEEAVPREYQALVEKYGASRLAELAETATRDAQLQQRQQVREAAEQNAQGVGGGIGTTLTNLVTKPVRGVMALAGRLDEAKNSTGRYNTMTPYTYGDALNVYADTGKQTVTQQIEGDGSNLFRKGAAILYQAGTSALESVVGAITLGPVVSASTSAMEQYARTLSEASERGATSQQATLLATANAALDYVMDKIPMDRLFSLAKSGSTSALKAALKQAGIEASTEGASFIGSQLLDMAILQQNSEYAQSIQNYMEQRIQDYASKGITQLDDAQLEAIRQEATRQANKDILSQAGQQALVAGISGGVSAGISTAVGNARTRRAEKAANAARQDVNAAEMEATAAAYPQPAPEQTAASQLDPTPTDTTPEPAAGQPLQNPQQLPREPIPTPEQIRAAQQERDIQAEADRIRYENQKTRAKARKDLLKVIERTQADVDAGKGSPARLKQLLDKLYQMDMEEADYPRTRQEAIAQQIALVDSMSQEQHNAYIRRETGEATNRPNKTATNRLKAAKAELDRLRDLSDADYARELRDMGLSGNTRAPWLDSASANLEALGETNAARQADLVRSMADRVREASVPDQPETRPESVPDLSAATDYLRSRLNPDQEQATIRRVQPQKGPASSTDTVSNLVKETATQRRTQQEAALQAVQEQAAAMTGNQEPTAQAATTRPDTLGMQSEPSEDIRKSRSVTNSGLNNPDPDIQAGYRETLSQDQEAGDYAVKHNADTLTTARQRTSTPERVRAEYDYLVNKPPDSWTAEDVATGRLVAKELFKSGDSEAVTALNKQLARVATNAGQVSQAFAISGTMRDAADPQAAAESATARLMNMKQEETTFAQKKGGPSFEQWRNDIANEYTRLGMAIDSVPEGDTDAMRDVVRQISQSRNTTAWFGTSSKLTKNAERILKKLDYDTLKKIADTQLAAMPDDFRKRSAYEVAQGVRKQGMLSSLKTIERNLAGNSATGLLDALSDSSSGRLADMLLSKFTGKRTTGNDLKHGKTYLNAAKDSMDFASLCVELNVPIETDANASFDAATGANGSGKYIGKTFRSTGNPMMRFLYGYQKYMSYALEVSDKIFEGGTNSAVTESLNNLKNSNLSDAEIQQLAEFTANRRTFKDATWEEGGKTYGSSLSRTAKSLKNIAKGKGGIVEAAGDVVGDTVLPFPGVPMNVAQTGIDYTVGVGKGAAEIVSIIRDARAGKEINVARQRQAASDFGRGTTGMALVGIMTAAAAKGIIQVHNDSDKNKKALDQSQGLSGAQINWSALSRAAEGGSEEWQSGDVVTSLDFLEPFNTQMYLGVELSKEDTMKEILVNAPKATFSSVVSSFMDSPMVDGLNQLNDLISSASTAAESGNMEDMANALADYGGDVASSFVPQFVRQTAQTMDGYYRDTRGETSLDYAKNNLMSAIPGASQKLPEKMDGFGKEQKRGGFVENFLDPTNTHRIEINEFSGYLDDLSGKTGDTGIYPERQAPLTVKNAVGDEVTLTGGQRETYQKTYGQWIQSYYSTMIKNKAFSSLSDELKVKAMKQAKEIAASRARASVTDFRGPKAENSAVTVRRIVRDVTLNNLSSYLKGAKTDWANDYNASENLDSLESAYAEFQKLPSGTKQEVLSKSTGDVKTYLVGRESGLNGTIMTSIIHQIQLIPEENRQKASYQYQAVASTKGLSESQMDTAMKLYMKDGSSTETKYDYIRQELGLSPSEYAAAYYAYSYTDLDGDGKTKKNEAIQGIIDLGFDRQTAAQLYAIYQGTSKSARSALAKFEEEHQ